MAKTLIKSLTASSSSSLDFVDGTSDVVMDNTYPVYEFHFVNMHPATDSVSFSFQVNATDDAGAITILQYNQLILQQDIMKRMQQQH